MSHALCPRDPEQGGPLLNLRFFGVTVTSKSYFKLHAPLTRLHWRPCPNWEMASE